LPDDDQFAKLEDPAGTGPMVLLQRATRIPAEPAPVHLDLYTSDRDHHIERLLQLGATYAASDTAAAVIEDLEDSLGEGPCLDASRGHWPVLQPDLVKTGMARWPGFTSSAANAGIAAVFAFPLEVGVIQLGVRDLYRTTTGPLDALELAEALDAAIAATTILVDMQLGVPTGKLHPLLAAAADRHREIHQATGMISAQAAVGLAEALLLMRARAYAGGRPLVRVATDPVNRHLTFQLEMIVMSSQQMRHSAASPERSQA
jgi:hypothetical protein